MSATATTPEQTSPDTTSDEACPHTPPLAERERDRWAFWRAARAGKAVTVIEGQPEPGFYLAGKHRSPVAIWYEDGEVVAVENGHRIGGNRLLEVWTYCKATSEEEYARTVGRCAGDATEAAIYDRLDAPSDPLSLDAPGLLHRLALLRAYADDPDTEDRANRLGDAIHLTRKIGKLGKDTKKSASEPARAEVARLEAPGQSVEDAAEALLEELKTAAITYLEVMPEGTKLRPQIGNAIGLKRRKVVVITDPLQAAIAVLSRDPEALDAALRRAVSGLLKNGEDVPGVTTEEEVTL